MAGQLPWTSGLCILSRYTDRWHLDNPLISVFEATEFAESTKRASHSGWPWNFNQISWRIPPFNSCASLANFAHFGVLLQRRRAKTAPASLKKEMMVIDSPKITKEDIRIPRNRVPTSWSLAGKPRTKATISSGSTVDPMWTGRPTTAATFSGEMIESKDLSRKDRRRWACWSATIVS